MTAENILPRLDRVKQTGPDRWAASCPAHEDKSPSLSIRELPDGRVLLHCFTGCPIDAVLAAVNLEMSDLFPPRSDSRITPERRPFNALDVLRAIYGEVLVVQIAAHEIRRRSYLRDPDIDRLDLAIDRIETGLSMAEGARRYG